MRLIVKVLCVVALAGLMAPFMSKHFSLANPKSLFSAIVAEENVSIVRNVRYGPHPRNRLDVYHPADATRKAVILFLYGGRWRSGERSSYGFVGAALASRGITAVIADYRLYPEVEYPGFLQDAALAYAHTMRSIASGRPIVVMGHSAGAHMAALLTLDKRFIETAGKAIPMPSGLVGLAGPYAFDPTTSKTTKHIFKNVSDPDQVRPVAFVTSKAPPSLLIHGHDDQTVRLWNQRALEMTLREAGVEVQARELKDVSHIGVLLTLARPYRWRHDVLDQIVSFAASLCEGRTCG